MHYALVHFQVQRQTNKVSVQHIGYQGFKKISTPNSETIHELSRPFLFVEKSKTFFFFFFLNYYMFIHIYLLSYLNEK